MGLLDRLLGRSTPAPPRLDQLFAVPDAALTLEAALGLRPTGVGSVAFRATEGGAFGAMESDLTALLDADDGPKVERSQDAFGYTWLLVRQAQPDAGEVPLGGSGSDLAGLVTDLHAVNASLEAQGFGPMLLCSLVSFTGADGRRLALVYLYKRGTFYPFAPTGDQQRDTAFELSVRGALAGDLTIEPDLGRWFPVWGAPGL